jgi:hypothetical protein
MYVFQTFKIDENAGRGKYKRRGKEFGNTVDSSQGKESVVGGDQSTSTPNRDGAMMDAEADKKPDIGAAGLQGSSEIRLGQTAGPLPLSMSLPLPVVHAHSPMLDDPSRVELDDDEDDEEGSDAESLAFDEGGE